MADIYIDGRFLPEEEAKISVLDRAVQLGDGLFETVRGHLGKPAFLGRHLQRLRTSADYFGIPFPIGDDEINHIISELCKRNNIQEARIRLTLTRGVHPGGLSMAGGTPSFIAITEPYVPYPEEKYRKGYFLIVSENRLFSKSALSGHKTLNYLAFLLARNEAARLGADEALLLNELENVAECSSANIFCFLENELVTPDLGSGILPGVVRDVVIELAENEGVHLMEKPLSFEVFLKAKEVFITSSLRGVMPVFRVGDKTFKEDRPVTESFRILYSTELDAACRG